MHVCVGVWIATFSDRETINVRMTFCWHLRSTGQFLCSGSGFLISNLPLFSELLARYSDCGTHTCAAAAGQYKARGFSSQLLSQHKLVVKSQFYIAMARYTNNSGITRRAGKEKRTERKRGKGGDWVAGDITLINAETHVEYLLTVWICKTWTVHLCAKRSRQLP